MLFCRFMAWYRCLMFYDARQLIPSSEELQVESIHMTEGHEKPHEGLSQSHPA